MEDHQHDGQRRQQKTEHERSSADTLGLGAAVTITVGSVLLIAGLSVAMSDGYKVGPYAGFAGGLTVIAVATTVINGGVALLCHRMHANARDKITSELCEANRNARTIIAMMAERNTASDDQVGAARRGHEN